MNDIKKLKELSGSYKRVFKGKASAKDCERVLADLTARCFGEGTTFSESHARMGFNEGRRSVYEHIKKMRNLDTDKLMELPREYTKAHQKGDSK